jgi:hypothetical protein
VKGIWVSKDQQLDAVQSAHLVFVAGVEAGGLEPFEQLVGAFGMHAVAAAHRDVA